MKSLSRKVESCTGTFKNTATICINGSTMKVSTAKGSKASPDGSERLQSANTVKDSHNVTKWFRPTSTKRTNTDKSQRDSVSTKSTYRDSISSSSTYSQSSRNKNQSSTKHKKPNRLSQGNTHRQSRPQSLFTKTRGAKKANKHSQSRPHSLSAKTSGANEFTYDANKMKIMAWSRRSGSTSNNPTIINPNYNDDRPETQVSNDRPNHSQRSKKHSTQGKNNSSDCFDRHSQHSQKRKKVKSKASVNIEKHMRERKKKIALKKARAEDEEQNSKKSKAKCDLRKVKSLTSKLKKKKAMLPKKGEDEGFSKIKVTDADRCKTKKVSRAPKKNKRLAEKSKVTLDSMTKKSNSKGKTPLVPCNTSRTTNIADQNGGKTKKRPKSKKEACETQISKQGHVKEQWMHDDGIRVTGVDPNEKSKDRIKTVDSNESSEEYKKPISSINIVGCFEEYQKPVSALGEIGWDDDKIDEKPIPSIRVIGSNGSTVENDKNSSSVGVIGSSDAAQNINKPSRIRVTGSSDDIQDKGNDTVCDDNSVQSIIMPGLKDYLGEKKKQAMHIEKNEMSCRAIDWASDPNLARHPIIDDEDDINSEDIESITPDELRSQVSPESKNGDDYCDEGVECFDESEEEYSSDEYETDVEEATYRVEKDAYSEGVDSHRDVESESEDEPEDKEGEYDNLQTSFLGPLPTFEKRSYYYEAEYDNHSNEEDHEDDEDDEESEYEFQPDDFDVCLEAPEHPGTRKFLRAIKHAYSKHGDVFFSRTVYKTIQTALMGRNFYIWKDEKEAEDGKYGWREASARDIMHHMTNEFEDIKRVR